MCEQGGQHPPGPAEMDEATGWPVHTSRWSNEDVRPTPRQAAEILHRVTPSLLDLGELPPVLLNCHPNMAGPTQGAKALDAVGVFFWIDVQTG